MSTYFTQALILSQTDRGEADQLFNLYTFSHGKALALARSSRKIKSKLRGHLQMFALLNVMIAPGRGYDHIAGVTIRQRFDSIGRDLKKVVLATHAMELVDTLTKPGVDDPRILQLLLSYFETLDTQSFSAGEWRLILQAFTIKLLSLLGFDPPAEVASDISRLDQFLKHHLEAKLQTETFILRLKP